MRRLTLRPLLPILFVTLADALLKEFVRSTYPLGSRTPLAGDLLLMTPGLNPGAALGISVGSVELIALLSLIAVGLLLGALVSGLLRRPAAIAGVTLIAGGAVGNLIDRLAHGAVLDFLDLGIGTLRIPTFNLADVAISVGFTLALLDAFRSRIDPD
jgi:signal peptidase II